MDALKTWKTFSVFISSTFADMQAERDYLKNIIFPKVEEELGRRRIHLEIVDLRWGVETTTFEQEEEREANILKVCLDEIKRCRPFFIGLLGDRYGWVPAEDRIKKAIAGELSLQQSSGKSVTALEIEFGVLASTDQLTRSIFYFREPLPYQLMSVEKAAQYSDEFNGLITLDEKEKRLESLQNLKGEIVSYFGAQKLGEKVKTYAAIWDEQKGKVNGLEKWGETVYNDILAECKSHALDIWDQLPQNWIEEERELLDGFVERYTHDSEIVTTDGEENISAFCGRKALIEELKRWLLSNENQFTGLILTGESGSGKSAVFAQIYRQMKQNNECVLLAHSAGISLHSGKVMNVLKIWIGILLSELGIGDEQDVWDVKNEGLTDKRQNIDEPLETPIETLQNRFAGLLSRVAETKRVILLIDALDCFEPTARAQYMSWLPTDWPDNVRLMATAISDTEKNAIQYHKNVKAQSLEEFSEEEAIEMLHKHSLLRHKNISARVEKIMMDKIRNDGKPAISSPLWLSLALNSLMAIDQDDFEKMTQLDARGDLQIDTYLAQLAKGFSPEPEQLFISLIGKASDVFGKEFTPSVFRSIGLSRNGLREKDLESLLSPRWDTLDFANLRRWFNSHLILQGEEQQWNIAHAILRNAIRESIPETEKTQLKRQLAEYFLSLPATDTLHCTETLYHLAECGNWKRSAQYLGGDLNEVELSSGINFLYDAIVSGDFDLNEIAQLPEYITENENYLYNIFSRYVCNLNIILYKEGNLAYRLLIFEKLYNIIAGKKTLLEIVGYYSFGILLSSLGEIHLAMGHFEQAFVMFEKALALNIKLDQSNPSNEELKLILAISVGQLGDIFHKTGQTQKALNLFDSAIQIMEELYKINPNNKELKNFLAMSYSKLGEIHYELGCLKQALNFFEIRSKLGKELCEANSRDEWMKYGLAISYEKLGNINKTLGFVGQALNFFEKEVEIFKEIYHSNPKNETLKNGLAISYEKLGEIYQEMGHLNQALNFFEERFKLGKELYELNPKNEMLKLGFAVSHERLGIVYKAIGQMEQALNSFENYHQLTKELYQANNNNESLKHNFAISYELLGDIHETIGNVEQALNLFDYYNQLMKELLENNPQNEKLKYGFAVSYELLGGIHQALGNKEKALNLFDNFNRLMKELLENNPQNERLKHGFAKSFDKLSGIHYAMDHKNQALNLISYFNQLMKELHEKNPLNQILKHDFAKSFESLGHTHQAVGNIEEALNSFNYFNKLMKELIEEDNNNNNTNFSFDLGVSYCRLAVLFKTVDIKKAALFFIKSIYIFQDGFQVTHLQKYLEYRDISSSGLDIIIHEYIDNYYKLIDQSAFLDALTLLHEVEELSDSRNEIEPNLDSVWTQGIIKENLSCFTEEISDKIKYLAFSLEKRLEVLHSIDDEESLRKVIPVVVQNYGQLSWFFLFEYKFSESESSVCAAIELGRKNKLDESLYSSYLYTNWAHSLLFQGKYVEAKKIYLEWKDKTYPQEATKTFKLVFLQDLDELEKAGIIHPDVAKIRKLLNE